MMSRFTNILAVLDSSAEASPLVQKLMTLSGPDTDISLIRVVYEGVADLKSKHIDVSAELKELVLEAERSALRDEVEATGTHIDKLTCAALWNPRIWAGALHAAASTAAELIVKTSAASTNFAALRTPDDWNLLRHASTPVLLTQPRAWSAKPTVVAALDVYDPEHGELNDRILAVAHDLAGQMNAELHLASVFPMLSTWLDEVTTISSYHKLRKEIESEIFEEIATLTAEQGIEDFTSHALEGLAVESMKRLLASVDADVLVIGTKARRGVAGLLLGNTAEKLLHEVDSDVLTVP